MKWFFLNWRKLEQNQKETHEYTVLLCNSGNTQIWCVKRWFSTFTLSLLKCSVTAEFLPLCKVPEICHDLWKMASDTLQVQVGYSSFIRLKMNNQIFIPILYVISSNDALLQMSQFGNLLLLNPICKPNIFTHSVTERPTFYSPKYKTDHFCFYYLLTHETFKIHRMKMTGLDIWLENNMRLTPLQTHPCNENNVFPCEVFLTGKNLFSLQGWVCSASIILKSEWLRM